MGHGIIIWKAIKLNSSFQFKNFSVKLINDLVDSFNILFTTFFLRKNSLRIANAILSNLQCKLMIINGFFILLLVPVCLLVLWSGWWVKDDDTLTLHKACVS